MQNTSQNCWVFINKNQPKTILVIPGWSILPHYFSTVFPQYNLLLLNPYYAQKNHFSTNVINKCTELSTFSTQVIHISTFDQLPIKFDHVFYLSLGFQWALHHAPYILEKPGTCWAPCESFSSNDVQQLSTSLLSNSTKALTAFYKSCCPSLCHWKWWKTTMLPDHLNQNSTNHLIEWLTDLYSISFKCINFPKIQFMVDPNDPIGIKPQQTSKNIHYHSYGHLPAPNTLKLTITN